MKRIPIIFVLMGAFVPWAANGQFSIDWSTIDGGGGTSSSGGFSLSGAIGQPDAGAPQQGGEFEVTGGFWPGVPTVIQTPNAPELSITRDSDTGGVIIFWAIPDEGFELRSSITIGRIPSPWLPVAPLVIQTDPTGSFRFIQITDPTGKDFFKFFPTDP